MTPEWTRISTQWVSWCRGLQSGQEYQPDGQVDVEDSRVDKNINPMSKLKVDLEDPRVDKNINPMVKLV